MLPRPARPLLAIRLPKVYDKSHVVHLRQVGSRYKVDYFVDGRRIRRSLKTDNYKVVLKLRNELEMKLQARQLHEPENPRLEDFLQEYIPYIEATLRPKEFRTRAGIIRRFAAGVPGLRLGEITPAMIEAFLMGLKGGMAAPKTWNNALTGLRTMFGNAKDHQYVADNVAKKVKRRREVERSIRFLKTNDEIERLLSLFAGSSMEAVAATFVFAGLRRSELCWLTWDDVDLDRSMIYVREKTIDGKTWFPKTKRNRGVPISKRLLPFLQRQRQTGQGIWVFPSPHGKRWDPDNLSDAFRSVVRAAGLPWTLLDLRHTFGSHLAMKGVSLYKISTLMGNSPEIARRHYAALIIEQMHGDVEF